MKTVIALSILLAVGFSGCAGSKPQPKLCTVTIADPAKTKKQTANAPRKCYKRKHLWSQFGIEE